jgi:hypothetical protein
MLVPADVNRVSRVNHDPEARQHPMSRFSIAALLLLAGGVLLLVGLPLQWSSGTDSSGSLVFSVKGFDYASYDYIVTIALAILLILSAVGVFGARRWGRRLGLVGAVMTCLWAVLIYFSAARNPTIVGLDVSTTISVGFGAIVLLIGAGLALVGAILSFRGPRVAKVATAAP